MKDDKEFKLCKTSFILGATYALAKDMKADGCFKDMSVADIAKMLLEDNLK